MIVNESNRITFETDSEGRSILKFSPACAYDVGLYKVVARNKIGQTVAHTRILEGTSPDAPDFPEVAQISDTEVLLNWHPPKYDGNSPIICYGLQYKAGDKAEWIDAAKNIDHEFYVVRNLEPEATYEFRLSSRNAIGWSDPGTATTLVKTKTAGAPKVQLSRTMQHLQEITDSGSEVVAEAMTKPNYSLENQAVEWITSTDVQDNYKFISEIHK